MQQTNKWGVSITTQQISEATASVPYKTLPAGVYNAILADFEFKSHNKAGNFSPMIVATMKVVDGADTVDLKEWWLMTSTNQYPPMILGKIAGICDAWGIAPQHRAYINVNGTDVLNPAETLKESLLEMYKYADCQNAAKNMMVGVQVDVEDREVKSDSGEVKILSSNKIKSFLKPQDITAQTPISKPNLR